MLPLLLLRRAYAHLVIAVPPMGDSISEGTVASVLKKAGDRVEENETIAQIETDKVTIDVKAPHAGVLVGFGVVEQDTVVPGQALATLDASAAAADAAASASAPAPPPYGSAARGDAPAAPAGAASPPAAAVPAAAAAPPPPHEGGGGGRVPSIRFPPRYTADGRRISNLSPAEAEAAAAAAGAAAPEAAAAAAASAPAAAAAAAPRAAAAAAAPPAAAASASSSSGSPIVISPTAALRGNGIVAGARPRARGPPSSLEVGDRALSQLEMDMIELGGAAPYEKREKKKKG